jgi:aldehyde dehydrogenase (NAD+)
MQNFRALLDKQKEYFNSNDTKTYEWRIEQLERMERMLKENALFIQDAVGQDFKTASEEKVFEVLAPLGTIEFTKSPLREWMKPTSPPVTKALAASGHTTRVIREPYVVSLCP